MAVVRPAAWLRLDLGYVLLAGAAIRGIAVGAFTEGSLSPGNSDLPRDIYWFSGCDAVTAAVVLAAVVIAIASVRLEQPLEQPPAGTRGLVIGGVIAATLVAAGSVWWFIRGGLVTLASSAPDPSAGLSPPALPTFQGWAYIAGYAPALIFSVFALYLVWTVRDRLRPAAVGADAKPDSDDDVEQDDDAEPAAGRTSAS